MKTVLIVFSGPHFAYSPTTMNLFSSLNQRGYDVTVLTDEPSEQFSSQRIVNEKIHYITNKPRQTAFERLCAKVTNLIGSKRTKKVKSLLNRKARGYIQAISAQNVDIVIAVDFFCLWCVQQLKQSAHLVSLEILENDPYYEACDFSRIRSVAIQSEQRYNYLFKTIRPPISILPNSPFYDDFEPDYENRDKTNLIFCGSAVPEFGIFNCLDFLMDYPQYKLTVKGAVPPNTKSAMEQFYGELLKEGRLVLDDTYMSSEQLNRYISSFRIGLVFYDFYRFNHMRKFNYYTGPSGKLYQYFNSGVPVIGNDLIGFDIVNKGSAGKLIKCLSSAQIKEAIDTIENSYLDVARNAKRISADYDLQKYMDRYIVQLTRLSDDVANL